MNECLHCKSIESNILYEDGEITKYYCNSCGMVTMTRLKEPDSNFLYSLLYAGMKQIKKIAIKLNIHTGI